MRTLKWDPWFDPEKETSIAIAWISFPYLPPNYFVKERFFISHCVVIHSELYPKKEEEDDGKKQEGKKEKQAQDGNTGGEGLVNQAKSKQNNKIDNMDHRKERDARGKMVEAQIKIANKWIKGDEDVEKSNAENQVEKISTKKWILDNFGKQFNEKEEIIQQNSGAKQDDISIKQTEGLAVSKNSSNNGENNDTPKKNYASSNGEKIDGVGATSGDNNNNDKGVMEAEVLGYNNSVGEENTSMVDIVLVVTNFIIEEAEEEKQGGLPVSTNEILDFTSCIQTCSLIDVRYSGSKFTWWNGRTNKDCIFKRLDRILVNQQLLDIMPSISGSHLIRHGSDHAPLHLECNCTDIPIGKPFKFLNFWTKHQSFMEVVKLHWKADFSGNPFHIATIEDTIKVQEWQFEMNPTRENKSTLQQAQAKLTRYLHLEEEYWKQKAGMEWFNEGDRNKKFFHSYVRGTRRKLALERIQDQNGVWVETAAELGDEAKMEELPTEGEVKEAVFSLNSESASGPDGFTGLFYQKCWDTIKEDVIMMVLSKVLHNRISEVLPRIISSNQTGSVNGRIIVENVLLAQEVVRDINIRASNTNVVITLDMTKAYDRLSWIFLTRVLRQFSFGEIIIDMVWRLISNNWYSVLINGQSHGFFRSSRGVKQGDPLSITLFVIAVEVLSRSLNKLHEKPKFISCSMPKWSPQINHLSYADDTIPFCSGDRYSVKKMMKTLRKYEKASRQMVNNEKSSYYTHHKVSTGINNIIKRYTEAAEEEEIEVNHFVHEGEWNFDLLQNTLNQELAQNIRDTIRIPIDWKDDDPCWILEPNGQFTVKSAWDFITKRENKVDNYCNIWEKDIPIKINFFMWSVWRARISTNDILKRMQINLPSRCWCCEDHKEETVTYLFLTPSIAAKL
ncbi:uncharacterized protein LOC132053756 [Lycium ferocissimum]|uniref:uncharacterized protein LOC132053756 n=1 Tax=Lycium ferocissimum TaxID=112874 RepID=UPI0028167F57|nr:uncharacterized protein LOC132053756 [Lycium ferocissimum]